MAGRKDVLIVSVLLPIIIDLALRSTTQGLIEVLRIREHSVLEGMDGYSCRSVQACR
jgi:hypothetical protein